MRGQEAARLANKFNPAPRYVARRFEMPDASVRLQVGFMELTMSVLAEFLLVTLLQDRSIGAHSRMKQGRWLATLLNQHVSLHLSAGTSH